VKNLNVVAADSAAAVLDKNFCPLQIVACAAVLVKPPYRMASECMAEPIFADVEKGHELVVHELELCNKLLKNVKAEMRRQMLSIWTFHWAESKSKSFPHPASQA